MAAKLIALQQRRLNGKLSGLSRESVGVRSRWWDRFGKGGEVLFDKICRKNGITHRLTAPASPIAPTRTSPRWRFERPGVAIGNRLGNGINKTRSSSASALAMGCDGAPRVAGSFDKEDP